MFENDFRPPSVDVTAAQRWLRRGAVALESAPWLHEEVARRMAQRLEWIAKPPVSWGHWSAQRSGLEGHALVAQRYPKAQSYVLDWEDDWASQVAQGLSKPWWSVQRWQSPKVQAGAPSAGLGMLWANMALHMQADPQALFRHWLEALQVDGFVMFSGLGSDTLRELRQLYAEQGWGEPMHQYTDMHDWGDMLVQAGFADPVMDMERITLTFDTPERALAELRTLGRNLHVQRFQGLRGKAWHQNLCRALQSQADKTQDGRIALSFEVVYGHAVKPRPRMPVAAQSTISLAQMRETLRAGRGQGENE